MSESGINKLEQYFLSELEKREIENESDIYSTPSHSNLVINHYRRLSKPDTQISCSADSLSNGTEVVVDDEVDDVKMSLFDDFNEAGLAKEDEQNVPPLCENQDRQTRSTECCTETAICEVENMIQKLSVHSPSESPINKVDSQLDHNINKLADKLECSDITKQTKFGLDASLFISG